MCTTHLCLGTNAEGLRDLRRPLEFKNVKFLLSTSVSFESAIITCEIERGKRERRANMDRDMGHGRRPIDGSRPVSPHCWWVTMRLGVIC